MGFCGIIMGMEPESIPEQTNSGDSGILKSFVIYLAIFGFGFMAASFGGGVKDSVKSTANLAVNTAKETFAISGAGTGEFVPLKSGTSKNAVVKPKIVYKPKPSLPVVVQEKVVVKEEPSVIVTTSTSQIVLAENNSFVTSSSPIIVAPTTSVQSSPAEVVQNNLEQGSDIKFNPLIYEVRITGGTGKSNEDYVKIFNPDPKTVDLSGWKLRKRTQSGSESSVRVFPDGTSLAPGKVLTWANNDYAPAIGAELMSSQTLASNNSVGFLNKDGILIDAVGWGEIGSAGFIEGSAYSVNPEAGQVLLRKQSGGLLVDTQNNSADFEIY